VIQGAMTAAVAALSTAVDVTLIHAVVRPAGFTAVDDQAGRIASAHAMRSVTPWQKRHKQ
jgi:hypothetical protein